MSRICPECKNVAIALCNGLCPDCWGKASAKWAVRYNTRIDASGMDVQKLVNLLLTELWQHECKIIPDYMPPYPREDTQPSCVVEYTTESGEKTYLRYSKGPAQCFFWDMYGDDMQSPELAVIALSRAQPPRGATGLVKIHDR